MCLRRRYFPLGKADRFVVREEPTMMIFRGVVLVGTVEPLEGTTHSHTVDNNSRRLLDSA